MKCLVCNPDEATDINVAYGNYIRINLDNIFGDLRIVAHGEYDCYYKPRFCPECGRILRSRSSITKEVLK